MPKDTYKARSPQPPSTLPGSVEQSYRQKCKEIKKRIHEMESSNDQLTSRIARARRAIQRMRLERAFLLQQLEARTNVRVSDSEGSPSPPPTPSQKPLRMKRARKADSPGEVGGGAGGEEHTFIGFNPGTAQVAKKVAAGAGGGGRPRGVTNGPKKPQNAYMIFCEKERDNVLARESGKPGFELPKALAQAWRELKGNGQKEYFEEYDKNLEQWRRAEARGGRAESIASSAAAPAYAAESPTVGGGGGGGDDDGVEVMEE